MPAMALDQQKPSGRGRVRLIEIKSIKLLQEEQTKTKAFNAEDAMEERKGRRGQSRQRRILSR
jgi:hypothetical protein